MELIAHYNDILNIYNKHGFAGVLAVIANHAKESFGTDLELYSLSTSWIQDKQYIMKAKGVKGDVIVTWIRG